MLRGLFSLFMLLLFLGMFALGVVYGLNSWQLVDAGQTANGTVVGYNESVDEEGSITYKPILQYEVAGRGYVFNSPNASSPPAYDIGEEVELLYNPTEPGNARINNFWELWLVPILLAPLGGMLAFLTIAWIFISIWRRLRGIKATL